MTLIIVLYVLDFDNEFGKKCVKSLLKNCSQRKQDCSSETLK